MALQQMVQHHCMLLPVYPRYCCDCCFEPATVAVSVKSSCVVTWPLSWSTNDDRIMGCPDVTTVASVVIIATDSGSRGSLLPYYCHDCNCYCIVTSSSKPLMASLLHLLLSPPDVINVVGTIAGAGSLHLLPADDSGSRSCPRYCCHICCASANAVASLLPCKWMVCSKMTITMVRQLQQQHLLPLWCIVATMVIITIDGGSSISPTCCSMAPAAVALLKLTWWPSLLVQCNIICCLLMTVTAEATLDIVATAAVHLPLLLSSVTAATASLFFQ